jgi:hypothetical protein
LGGYEPPEFLGENHPVRRSGVHPSFVRRGAFLPYRGISATCKNAESHHGGSFGFVRDTDDGGLDDVGVRDEDGFDLGGADAFAGDL